MDSKNQSTQEPTGNLDVFKTIEEIAMMQPTQPGGDQGGDASGWFPVPHQLLPAKAEVAREWIGRRRAGMKGWREFFKSDKFRLPNSPALAARRLIGNVDHFQSNYLCVFLVLFIYCVLTSPLLLLALAACLAMFYVIRTKSAAGGGPLKIGGMEFSPALQYAAVALCSFPLFYVSGAGSVIFWVIGASIFVIILHAVMYASETIPGAEFEMETPDLQVV